MSKHTPGPWITQGGDRGAMICVTNDYNHPLSFNLSFAHLPQPLRIEGGANARRIVACVNACEGLDPEGVPEMLPLLKEAWSRLEYLDIYPTLREQMRQLIAKAEQE